MKHANLLLLNLALAARALAGDLNPALISEWPGGWVSDPAVRGTYAYLSSGGSGCQILDVSNPAAPRRVGFSAIRISGSTQFSGNHAYVPNGAAGLQVIDLSDPTNPRRVGGFDTGGSVSDVAIAGNYAYVVGDSLIVINISEPTHPVQVGSSSLRAYAVSVEVSGNNAFVIGSTHLPGQGDQWTLDSFDISDPAKPQPVGHLQRPGKPTSMAHSAQFVYVSADRYDLNIGGVQVINVSDPANPQWVAGDSNNRTTDRLAVAGNYLYLTKVSTDNRGALDIFDISTPASIRKVGTYFGSEVGGLDV